MLKKVFFSILSLCLTTSCYATWQIAGASVRTPGNQPNKIVDNTPPEYKANPVYNLETQPGTSLYNTVNNYCQQHGWQVRWKTKQKNYSVNINSTIGGNNVKQVLNRLLAYYPLHAKYDNRHKTITILSNK